MKTVFTIAGVLFLSIIFEFVTLLVMDLTPLSQGWQFRVTIILTLIVLFVLSMIATKKEP